MSDGENLGKTLPTARTTARNDGSKPALVLPDEPHGRFGGEARELGRGGMGRVLEVEDVALGRPVALKELLDPTAPSGRFVREARLTAQLEHPGVIPVYELGQRRDGAPYYAMRKVSGGTLEQALQACSSLEDRLTLLPHLLDVVQTIAYSHSKGILHRDLKPANVMVGKFGETLVLDWGLARPKADTEDLTVSGADGSTNPVRTMDGASIGTPAYMSPEQARGEKAEIDERTDVWSLGVMLFELLTGRLLFEVDTVVAMLSKVVNEPPPKVRSVEPRAPKALAEIADRALSRSLSVRYPSAVEMAAALETAMRSSAPPRRMGWWVVVAAAVLMAVAGTVVAGWGVAVDPRRRDRSLVDQQELNQQKAARAQAAWESGDVANARALANDVQSPLARGVIALTRASGVPEKAWSATTEAGCAQLAVHPGVVACATFGGLNFFGAKDGREVPRFSTGPSGWQHAVIALPDDGLFAVGGDDNTVHVVGSTPPLEVERLEGLGDSVRSLAASTDGTQLAIGLRDGRVVRWTRGEKTFHPGLTVTGPVTALAWSRDGLLAASGRDQTRVVKVDHPDAVLLALERPARALAFSASWPLFITAGRDVLAVSLSQPTRLYSGARHDISSVLLLGNRVLAASVDGAAQGWTIEGAPTGVLRSFPAGRVVLAAEPERKPGSADFYAAAGRTLEAWSWKRERFTQLPPELVAEPTAWTLGPDAAWCAGTRDGRLSCSESGRIAEGHKHAAPVVALAIAKATEGWVVLSAAADGAVLLSVPGRATSAQLSRPGKRALSLALAPDGNRLALAWDDGQLRLFSVQYEKEIESARDANVLALAFSPDGRTLAAGRADKRAVLYETESGKETLRLEGADGAVRAVAFSADGQQLAGGGDDRRVTLWATNTATPVSTFTGPEGSIGSVAFSPLGTQLAAGSDDGTVRVWSVTDARPEVEVRGHFGDARVVGFKPDGTLIEAGGDGVPRALDVR